MRQSLCFIASLVVLYANGGIRETAAQVLTGPSRPAYTPADRGGDTFTGDLAAPNLSTSSLTGRIAGANLQADLYGWGPAAGSSRWQSQYHPSFNVLQTSLPYNETEWQIYTNFANGTATTAGGTNRIDRVSGTPFDGAWAEPGLPMFYFEGTPYIVATASPSSVTVKNSDGSAVTFNSTKTGVFYFGGVTAKNICQVSGTVVTTKPGYGTPFFVTGKDALFINGTKYAFAFVSNSEVHLSTNLGTVINATCNQYGIIDDQMSKIALQGLASGDDEEAYVMSLHADGVWVGGQYRGAGKYRPIRHWVGEFPAGNKQVMIQLTPSAALGNSGALSLGGPLDREVMRMDPQTNQVNHFSVLGGPGGSSPALVARPGGNSSDANVAMAFDTYGEGAYYFFSHAFRATEFKINSSGGPHHLEVTSDTNPTLSASGGNLKLKGNLVDVSGQGIVLPFGKPATSSAECVQGQLQFDASYVYTCVAPNTWRRAATESF